MTHCFSSAPLRLCGSIEFFKNLQACPLPASGFSSFVDHIGRHKIHRAADGTQQQAALQSRSKNFRRKPGAASATSNAQIMPLWRKISDARMRLGGAAIWLKFVGLERLAAITSSCRKYPAPPALRGKPARCRCRSGSGESRAPYRRGKTPGKRHRVASTTDKGQITAGGYLWKGTGNPVLFQPAHEQYIVPCARSPPRFHPQSGALRFVTDRPRLAQYSASYMPIPAAPCTSGSRIQAAVSW